jgi:hypothetical protein
MKLSPQMLGVLHSIAHPHPDDEPFPPVATVKALMLRGLVKTVSAREELANPGRGSMDIIMAALGSQRLIATPAGLTTLKFASQTNPLGSNKE